jgi:apolipoprotein N-acyltransferase
VPPENSLPSVVVLSSRPLARIALAGLLGVAHAFAFAPFELPWLQWLALAGLFALVLTGVRPRQAALAGFAFGLGGFGVGVSWVYISMHVYGEMPALLAAAATALFCAFLSLYPALALWVATRIDAGPSARALFVLPAAWAGAEWLRGVLLTGFPWLASGYAHSSGPLAGYAPVLGVHGVTLLAALLSGSIALMSRRRRPGSLLSLAALAAALAAGGQALRAIEWTQPYGEPLRVQLLQGNVPQNLKFADGGMKLSEEAYLPLLRRTDPDGLVVLPESVFPLPLSYLPPATIEALNEIPRGGAALIFGIFIEEPPGHFYNSAIGLSPAGDPPQRYSKRHLVPFGEFIPWGFRWFVDRMNMPIGDQQRGAPYQAPMRLAGQRIAVNICYEDLFGAEIRQAWGDPAQAPTLLLNLSNLGWFDDSLALPQHLQKSRLRALETGRPVLRATNTGATAVIDADGRVRVQLPHRTAGILTATVQGRTGETPYLRWGDAPALISIAAVLAMASLGFRRRPRRNGGTTSSILRLNSVDRGNEG